MFPAAQQFPWASVSGIAIGYESLHFHVDRLITKRPLVPESTQISIFLSFSLFVLFSKIFSAQPQCSNMESKTPTVGQLPSGLVGGDPETGIETIDIERIERVYR